MPFDLAIIGAGINGAAIARDAAGRGLSVLICDQGDIAGATSSSSSKMIHGGLRYLEHYEFRLVAEALAEREVMLRIAPHLTRPLQIVMPHVECLRPSWMIRIGLMLYDSLGRLRERTTLPASRSLKLGQDAYGAPLLDHYRLGYVYSDVLDDDARLTLACVKDAAERGATVLTHSPLLAAERSNGLWQLHIDRHGSAYQAQARILVNAAGPWVGELLTGVLAASLSSQHPKAGVQLIRGSHIVVPQLYAGEHGYLLQHSDGRVVFVLPFADHYSLIGTTEVRVEHPGEAQASAAEIAYLCQVIRHFFRQPIRPQDVVWHYAGLRPLYDDGHGNPADVTRDYRFVLDVDHNQTPLLSIFGGKLTTHRRLAEAALTRLAPWLPGLAPPWTAHSALPGGDFASLTRLQADLQQSHPHLPTPWLRQLAQRHGSRSLQVLAHAQQPDDLGEDFGGSLYQREVEYCMAHEWAMTVEDLIWRRTKAGIRMTAAQRQRLADWLAQQPPSAPGDDS